MSQPDLSKVPAKTIVTAFERSPSIQAMVIIALILEARSETRSAIKDAMIAGLGALREQLKAPGMSIMASILTKSMSDEDKAKFDYDAMIAELEAWDV